MRSSPTPAEKKLWEFLKHGVRGLKFRRSYPIAEYVVDFYCHRIRLVFEADGPIHNHDIQKFEDKCRQAELELWGAIVIRFTNDEIEYNFDEVKIKIEQVVDALLKQQNTSKNKPLPIGRGGGRVKK